MTPKEAIKQLEMDRELCRFNPMTGECEPMNEDCRKTADALDIAIEALEKQIPKKPKIIGEYPLTSMYDYWGYECPCCGNPLIDYPDHHCKCGQILNWSEEE